MALPGSRGVGATDVLGKGPGPKTGLMQLPRWRKSGLSKPKFRQRDFPRRQRPRGPPKKAQTGPEENQSEKIYRGASKTLQRELSYRHKLCEAPEKSPSLPRPYAARKTSSFGPREGSRGPVLNGFRSAGSRGSARIRRFVSPCAHGQRRNPCKLRGPGLQRAPHGFQDRAR